MSEVDSEVDSMDKLDARISDPSEQQIKNYEYFQSLLPELLGDSLKKGKHVLVYDESIKGIFDTFESAYRDACLNFAEGFVIQQVIDANEVVEFLSVVS